MDLQSTLLHPYLAIPSSGADTLCNPALYASGPHCSLRTPFDAKNTPEAYPCDCRAWFEDYNWSKYPHNPCLGYTYKFLTTEVKKGKTKTVPHTQTELFGAKYGSGCISSVVFYSPHEMEGGVHRLWGWECTGKHRPELTMTAESILPGITPHATFKYTTGVVGVSTIEWQGGNWGV